MDFQFFSGHPVEILIETATLNSNHLRKRVSDVIMKEMRGSLQKLKYQTRNTEY